MIFLAVSDRLTLFILVAFGLTIAILLLRAHRYLARQRSDDRALVLPRRPKSEPSVRLMDGPPELARWEVEMHRIARDLSAEVDSRVSVLRAMVTEADRAAARLEAALNKAAATGADDQGFQQNPPDPGSHETGQTASPEAVYALADYGFPSREIAVRLHRRLSEIQHLLDMRENSKGS